MTSRVFGVGLGVFLIALLWFVALVMNLIFYRIRSLFSVTFTCIAAVFTAIFLSFPRADDQYDSEDVYHGPTSHVIFVPSVADSMFIGRMVILGMLIMATLAGMTLMFYLEIVQPRRQPTLVFSMRRKTSMDESRIENIH